MRGFFLATTATTRRFSRGEEFHAKGAEKAECAVFFSRQPQRRNGFHAEKNFTRRARRKRSARKMKIFLICVNLLNLWLKNFSRRPQRRDGFHTEKNFTRRGRSAVFFLATTAATRRFFMWTNNNSGEQKKLPAVH